MFGFITVALVAETIDSMIYPEGTADWVPSLVMTVAFGVMTYLFGTTRARE